MPQCAQEEKEEILHFHYRYGHAPAQEPLSQPRGYET